jgi:hypothetical protein
LFTKGVRGVEMDCRVASKSGWYLRFLERVDFGELNFRGEEGDDGGEITSGSSVGSVDDDSELDETQLDRRL